MKKISQAQAKLLTFISFICFLVPLSIYVLWIYAFNLGTTQADRVTIFKDYFPDFMHGRWDTTLLSIFFCILAVIFSGNSFNLSGKRWKILNTTILILSSLLLLLNLWSMMLSVHSPLLLKDSQN